WNEDFLKELIFEILKKENFKILITYGKEEEKIGKNFIKNFSSGIIDWGCKDFEFWAGGLSFCKALITMDSGASHLASALNIPTIDIFEERNFKINSKRWHPWDVKHFLLKRPDFNKNSKFKKEIVEALLKVLSYG
ncbi:MAG: hypothetical protein HYU63_05170, partial [Armatimonadetes bacterium]|nr:hypothetical protein [Armatimonadota bacterium]